MRGISQGKTYYGQCPVYPSVSNPERDEPENERSNWNSQCDKHRPDTHVSRAFMLEIGLLHNCTAERRGRTNEECCNCSAKTHGRVRRTLRTSNVTGKAADERQKEDRPATKPIRQRPPEKGCATEDSDHKRCQVTSSLDGDMEVHRNVHKGGLDRCSSECCHERMEGHEEQVDQFLAAWPIVRIRVTGFRQRLELVCSMPCDQILAVSS